MVPDGIDHQFVFVIAQLLILTYLHWFPREMAYWNQQKPTQGPHDKPT